MIRFRSLYKGDHSDEIIDIPCRISKLSCGLICEVKDSTDGFFDSNDSFNLRESVSRRHLPQYSINFTTSLAMGLAPEKALRKLCGFRPYSSGQTNPEIAVSPVAIFQGRRESPYTRWTLIGAGLIQSLSVDNGFDELDGSLTEVAMTLLDLRFETDFLQSVDLRKMDPEWRGNAREPDFKKNDSQRKDTQRTAPSNKKSHENKEA